jgi:hypothetical protein
MSLWLIFLFFLIAPFPVIFWRRNWKVFLLSILPLIYAVFDVHLECRADYNSEACVWGYMGYLYTTVIGAAFYLTVTFFQVVISKLHCNERPAGTCEKSTRSQGSKEIS